MTPQQHVPGRIVIDDDGQLGCPLCGSPDGTHIDNVYVAARQEDREAVDISVNAVSGKYGVANVITPTGRIGEGRRHRIALMGWCENCRSEYAIVFTQHKGRTFVDAVPVNEGPIYDTGRRH